MVLEQGRGGCEGKYLFVKSDGMVGWFGILSLDTLKLLLFEDACQKGDLFLDAGEPVFLAHDNGVEGIELIFEMGDGGFDTIET